MKSTKYLLNPFLAKDQRLEARTPKELVKLELCYKVALFICFTFFSATYVNAQKGLFIKFSLGPGYTTEYSNINSSGFTVTKNHAIGWGVTDKFAVHIGEFGGLVWQKTEGYNYINLDSYGLGFSYQIPTNIKISVLGAYSNVTLAKKWSEATGDADGTGYGINMSVDKEWFIAKRWGVRVGPQLFWIKTIDTNYKFFNVSLNASVVFYLGMISK